MRAIYDESFMEMDERLDGGEELIFVATVPGRKLKTHHIRLVPEVSAGMTEAYGRARAHQSVFFLRVPRDYLSKRRIEAPE